MKPHVFARQGYDFLLGPIFVTRKFSLSRPVTRRFRGRSRDVYERSSRRLYASPPVFFQWGASGLEVERAERIRV